MKKIILSLAISLIISACAVHPDQVEQISYDEKSALQALGKDSKDISSGKSINLNAALVDYIYDNQNSFPTFDVAGTDTDKLQQLLPVYMQINSILSHSVMKNIGYYDASHAKLFSIMGTMSAKLIPISTSLFNSFNKSDPTYSVRADGIKRVYSGGRTFLIGYFSVLFVETEDKEVEQLLLSNLESFGPVIINSLPAEYRSSTRAYIEQALGSRVKASLANDYAAMLAKL